MYSFDVFNSIEDEKSFIIAAEPQYFDFIKSHTGKNKVTFVEGGQTRQHSVYNALKAVRKLNDDDIVVIHDSGRMYIDKELVETLLNEIKNGKDSAIPYKKQTSAIFDSEKNKYVNTSSFKIIETPQVFNFKKLKEAYKNKNLELYKDDGSIYINKHKCLNFVYNPKINIKITHREDLIEAERRVK
jgi:2-C-methyl-D-erythritol 4-phosphate cytidylyltransferase